jgi:predicted ATPase
VRALRRWLATRSPRPVERIGRCRSFGQASAYSPLGEIVGGHPDLLERWPILGVALGRPAPPELHPLAVVQRLREAWVELLQELIAAGPLVVIVEDLHWAEPELLELLGAARGVQGPLLLVGTGRNEVELAAQTIRLDALPSGDASKLVDAHAPETLVQDVRAFVVERSDGNPLFVEEIIRMLADRGVTDAVPHDLVVPDPSRRCSPSASTYSPPRRRQRFRPRR